MGDTYSQLYYHWVWTPKYRKALISPEWEDELFKYITGIVNNLGQKMIRINGMPDHVHLLTRLRPNMLPSKFIQIVKKSSTDWINEQRLTKNKFRWQNGCGVFSVSHRAVPIVSKYIDNQKEHHFKKSFKKEYLRLLKDHGIEFKEQYLFEFFGEL